VDYENIDNIYIFIDRYSRYIGDFFCRRFSIYIFFADFFVAGAIVKI